MSIRIGGRRCGAAALLALTLATTKPFAQQVELAEPPGAVAEQRAAGERLGIRSVANLRDIGGYVTTDGKVVRRGRLYRSNQLSRIAADDAAAIEQLGLKCDFDLRRENEKDASPDRLPASVKYVWLNVMEDSTNTALPSIGRLLQNPKEGNAEWGDGKMAARFHRSYRQFVSLPSAQKSYREFFTQLAQEENLPAVVHCTSGKDRTGWAVAALLSLLGVPREQIVADHLRSNDNLLPGYQGMITRFTAAGGDPEILLCMLGVKPEYLEIAFDEVDTQYGSIENYFSKGLGIDAAEQAALRGLFLTTAE